MLEYEKKELSLLPHQFELYTDTTHRTIGLCTGFGGGKTFAIVRKAIDLMLKNIGFDGIITEPNYPLLIQILIPEVKDALQFYGITYQFNKSEMIFYCYISGKVSRIICKSMENYQRLIGLNAAWIILDEFDTAKPELGYNAYIKLLGRLRSGNVRQMVIASTPEGFGAMYRIFVTEASEEKRLIKAKTTDNKHLPEDFLFNLYQNYPDNLIDAYVNGEFCNLQSGSVYNFDREKHGTNAIINGNEPLHIGMDFNVHNMNAVVIVQRDKISYVVDEITSVLDTPMMIEIIKEKYSGHSIVIYPDASGKNNSSKSASVSDISLIKSAGLRVKQKNKNPMIKDRVISLNNSLEKGLLKINVERCPQLALALEQQVYDNGVPEKRTTDNIDDINDALGYYNYTIHPVVRHSFKERKISGF